MITDKIEDRVYPHMINGQEVWRAMVDGKIIQSDWPDRGSALAGMHTEQRRQRANREHNRSHVETMVVRGLNVETNRPGIQNCIIELEIELERKRQLLPQRVRNNRITMAEAARVLAALEVTIEIMQGLEAAEQNASEAKVWDPLWDRDQRS